MIGMLCGASHFDEIATTARKFAAILLDSKMAVTP